jgi:hypothetical protein
MKTEITIHGSSHNLVSVAMQSIRPSPSSWIAMTSCPYWSPTDSLKGAPKQVHTISGSCFQPEVISTMQANNNQIKLIVEKKSTLQEDFNHGWASIFLVEVHKQAPQHCRLIDWSRRKCGFVIFLNRQWSQKFRNYEFAVEPRVIVSLFKQNQERAVKLCIAEIWVTTTVCLRCYHLKTP